MSLQLAWQRWLGWGALAIFPPLALAGVVALPLALPLGAVAAASVASSRVLRPLPVWLENLLAPAILGLVVVTGGLRFGVLRPVANLLVLLAAVRLWGGAGSNRRFLSLVLLALLAVAGIASSTHPALAIYLVGLLAGVVLAVSSLLPRELARRWGTAPPATGAPGRMVLATVLLAVVVAVPLFVLFPRLRSPFAVAGVGARPVSGFREAVALHQLGDIKNSRRPMLRVRFPPQVTVEPAWLRFAGATLSHYRAGRWLETKKLKVQHEEAVAAAATLFAEVTLEQASDRLFVPPGTSQVVPPVGVQPWRDGAEAWRVPRQLEPPLSYQVWFSPSRVHSRAPGPEDLFVPGDLSALRELAREAVGGAQTPRAQAQALEGFLQRRFRYSTNTAAPLRADPVEWFLFTSRQGHCEFFASSMVLLLRVLGIPARLQTGFAGGEPLGGGEYLLRDANAHAWVLAYLDGQWEIFDPTPPEGRPAVGRDQPGWDWRDAWSRLEAFWDRWVLTFSLGDQLDFLLALGRHVRVVAPRAGAGLGALALVWWLWRLARKPRATRPALSPLGHLLRHLALAAGWSEERWLRSTPGQLVASVLPRLSGSRQAFLFLVRTHHEVAYAGAVPPSRKRLQQALREVVADLKRAEARARTTSGRGRGSAGGRVRRPARPPGSGR